VIPSPYSEKSLKQHFRVGDSGKWKIDVEANIDEITRSASERAASVTPTLSILSKIDRSGKTVYFAGDLETDLILRATYSRLIHQYSVSLPNREDIISGIIEATSEACPFLVTKCDIRDFYGSLNSEPILNEILVNTRVSPDLKSILRAIYAATGASKSVALRGLALSTLVAELALKDFDREIRKIPGVHRYFRYADDIIIFSIPATQVIHEVEKKLNRLGLELNSKSEIEQVRTNPAKVTPPDSGFVEYTYLGYQFTVGEVVKQYRTREFNVSIAPAKVSKRTTRIFLSLHAFLRDLDGSLLIDRLNYLSTNRSVYKTKHARGSRKEKIRTGLHYNYSRCGRYPASQGGRVRTSHDALELMKIDVVLKFALFSKNSEFSTRVAELSVGLQRQLQSISFVQGYKKRLMKRFTRERVGKICKVWGHE